MNLYYGGGGGYTERGVFVWHSVVLEVRHQALHDKIAGTFVVQCQS